MMTTIETYVRNSRSSLRKWALDPRVRLYGRIAAYFLGGFALSAASLLHAPLPLAMGLVLALTGWRSVLTAAGAAAGYLLFWDSAGYQSLVWLGCGLPTALLLGKRRIAEEAPLLLSAIAGLIVSASGLAFQILREDTAPVVLYLLRILLGMLSVRLFQAVRERRDRSADYLAAGCMVLSLSQIAPFGFSLGYVAAGALAAWGPLPGAAVGGLALDLSGIGQTSMTAVLCLSSLARPGNGTSGRLRFCLPALMYLAVAGLSGTGSFLPFFALALGGAGAALLPEPPEPVRRRGETGAAQVRLEQMAAVLSRTGQLLLQDDGIPIDEEALLLRTRERACGGCPNRKTCRDRLLPLPVQLLHSPLVDTASVSVPCKKPGRLNLELRRTQEQLRNLRADRERQREYRAAVLQQYRFLGDFLQQQADLLPRRSGSLRARYCAEVTVCSAGREPANGDRCASFAGPGCRHYLLLCDGMGTGLGAAQEGQSATELLRQMLSAGFPPEYALRSVNSLLVLRGRAAAVTVDLLELQLDSGKAVLYKWGAAPSWLLAGGAAEKIGTATPPPGLSVSAGRETVERLSLRRGEMLILVSDGVQMEEALLKRREIFALPAGELAAKLLERGKGEMQDDATAAVVRLCCVAASTS